jgi:dipeptidyl aminopeptidase/acylaminoacyl peptidase
VGEAEQIVSTLRERGRPVEYLRFEDEGHGLVKLPNRIAGYTAIGAFLDRWLQDGVPTATG